MAKLRSTTNQGARLQIGSKPKGSTKGIVSKGKNPSNPRKPVLAARIKNSQGIGGGLAINNVTGKASKRAQSAKGRGPQRGVAQGQSIASAAKRLTGKTGKTNLAPVKQPQKPTNLPKQPRNNFALHNSVSQADVTRLRKASSMPVPSAGGGGFKNFIGGN